MARFLVTGAAGFIGSHLVEYLRTEGHEVIGLDRRSGAEVQDDLLTMDFDPLLDSTDYVVHLAGQPGVRESWADFPAYSRGNIEICRAKDQRHSQDTKGRPAGVGRSASSKASNERVTFVVIN